MHGRTRSLVDRFEKREIPNSDEIPSTDTAPHTIPETAKASPVVVVFCFPFTVLPFMLDGLENFALGIDLI